MKILTLQPPSPPYMNLDRECAGGFGVGQKTERASYGHEQYPYYSLQLAYAAGVLDKAGHEVAFFDAQAERCDEEVMIERVEEFGPDCLIVVVSLPSLDADLKLIKAIRGRLRRPMQVICIGSVCRVLYEEIVASAAVDFVIIGEPETTVAALVDSLGSDRPSVPGIAFKKNGAMVVNPPGKTDRSLDHLPMIPYHLMSMENYVMSLFGQPANFATIVSSLGCSFGCGYYCPYPVGFGRHVRFRSVDKVLEEIEVVTSKYGVSDLVFRDQVFTLNNQRVRAICEGMLKNGISARWVCETRFDCLNDISILENMKLAGCGRIHFGLETGDKDLFESMGKPGAKFDQISEVVKALNRIGIDFHVHLIVGLPGETWRSVMNTAALLKRLKIYSINPSFIVPYPGTRFFEDAKRKNWITTYDWSRYTSREAIIRTKNMTTADLERAHRFLMNTYSLKSNKLMQHLFIEKMKGYGKTAMLNLQTRVPGGRKP